MEHHPTPQSCLSKHSGFKPPSARKHRQRTAACDDEPNDFCFTSKELFSMSSLCGYSKLDVAKCDELVDVLLDAYEERNIRNIEHVLVRILQTEISLDMLMTIGRSQLAVVIASMHQLCITKNDTRFFVRLATLLLMTWTGWMNIGGQEPACSSSNGAAPTSPSFVRASEG